jgi:hypothetical protein
MLNVKKPAYIPIFSVIWATTAILTLLFAYASFILYN